MFLLELAQEPPALTFLLEAPTQSKLLVATHATLYLTLAKIGAKSVDYLRLKMMMAWAHMM